MRTDIRLALPSKGRLEQDALEFLADSGLRVEKPNPRQYMARIPNLPGLTVIFQRPGDIVVSVRQGSVDLGITGLDVTEEQKASIEKALTDAGLGPKDGPEGKRPDMKDMKEKMEAALDAFVKDDFKAADVLPAPPAEAASRRSRSPARAS